MYLYEPLSTPSFTLQAARGELKLDCGFDPDTVAVDPEGGEAVGAMRLTEIDGVVSVRFWVAQERRGSRLGTELLRTIAPVVFASGARRLETRLPVQDLAAIRSAMRAGFRPDSGLARGAACDGSHAVGLGLLPDDGRGPAPRALPDLPGGALSDGTISLRPLRPGDFETHLRHRTSPDVYSGAALPLPPSVGEVAEVCEWRASLDWLRGRAALMVIDDGTGYQGTIGLYDVARIVGTAMIGYDLSSPARGRGYATRAVRLACRWAFEEVGMDRIWAGTDVHNAASQAVLRRAGFTLEGIEKGGLPALDGSRRDTLVWARLSTG